MGGWASRAFGFGAMVGAAICAPGAALAKDVGAIVGKAWVVDGNTLIVRGQRVRLFGVDAPDRKQMCANQKGRSYPCGLRAAFTLDALARGKDVQCQPRGIGADRTILATCSLAGLDLGSAMVEAGWAIVNTAFAPEYAETQAVAKAAKVGLWAGAFQEPAAWRAEHGA